MQPLKPDQKKDIRAAQPNVSNAQIDEYEMLLSERFMVPPEPRQGAPLPPQTHGIEALTQREKIERRLRELYGIIFGAEDKTIQR